MKTSLRPADRWVGWALAAVTIGLSVGLPLLLRPSETSTAPAAVACPEQRAQLVGLHTSTASELPGDLRCADLRDAVLDGLDLTQADLSGADLRGAHFDRADLGQADLVGADARGASFRDASLIQASMTGLNARGASFHGAELDQATLRHADLREAGLTGASLIQADLRGADLRGASLWWVNTIQAEVAGVRVDPVEAGVVQLVYLLVLGTLALVGLSITRLVRKKEPRGRVAVRVAVAAVASLAALASVFELAPLWTAHLWWPLLAAILLAMTSAFINAMAARRIEAPSRAR